MVTKASKPKKTAKKPSKKVSSRQKPSSGNSGSMQDVSRAVFRAEVGGVLLVLLALFTLLSLLTASRGQLTGSWVDLLRGFFGVGVWLVPVVMGAMGLWLVVRAVERMPNLPWQRPAGLLLIFLSFVTGISLLLTPELRMRMANEGDAGGQFGLFTANALQETVGTLGAWAFVTFIALSGVFLLADRLLVDAWYAFTDWNSQRSSTAGTQASLPSSPSVPMPSGKLPWWKHLFPPPEVEPLSPPPSGNLVRPEPVSMADSASGRVEARPTSTKAPPGPLRPLSQPINEGELLTPRIVGGAQDWKLPPLSTILSDWDRVADDDNHIRNQGRLIQETLALFGVPADFEGAYKGPSVTQYLIKPGYVERKSGAEMQRVKVKVAKIAALSNDLALALAAPSVRIEAPIPGTNYVGVEVPNQTSNVVGLKELMESDPFTEKKRTLPIALGEDVKGQPIVSDMARMPHLLIAGATGSGKSVCINSIIACLLLTHTPDNLRLLMIDPKMVELSVYNGVPHLLSPVVTEVDKAAGVLFWAVKEMERRYTLFSKANARDLPRYNGYLQKNGERPLPYIVVVVDEMADLMMAAPEEVEKHICRLAQMARAVGIHLIIATQRPSVDVITGLIKANFPARIAFAVTSQIDSRVILDVPGAERLLGRGDMLFMAPDAAKLERLQGTMVTDEEIARVVRYWKGIRSYESSSASSAFSPPAEWAAGGEKAEAPRSEHGVLGASVQPSSPMSQPPLFEQIEQMKTANARDALFDEAVEIVREQGRGSVNLLQRRLRIGYSRAARLVDQLHDAGIVGPDLGAGRGREYLGDESLAQTLTTRPHVASERTFEETDEDDAPPWEDDDPSPAKPSSSSNIWF